MSNESLKNKTLSGFVWRFAERCGAQGVSFIVSIILARILAPELFGVVALITVFTNILQVFVDSGLGNALIQKKNADDLDFSSVFYFNFTMCTLLYLVMFLAAPFIDEVIYSSKYDNLTSYIRVLSLVLVISGVKNIQHAYVAKKMIFKKFFFATLGGTIFAAVVGIVMALSGFGVWAIITQNLTNKIIDTVVLWFTVKWRPKLMFSFERLKGLLSYGWKLLCSSLLDVAYRNIRQLLIGKVYSAEDLSFYNEGVKIPSIVVNNINISIDSVLLPAMSREQDDKSHVKSMTRRSIKTSCYILWPIMVGIASLSNSIIRFLLGDAWLPCVPFLQIFCLVYAFYPIHTANLNAIKAMGRSDIFLKLEIAKKVVGLLILVVTFFINVQAIAVGMLISTVASSFINAFPNKRLLGYSYFDQIKDILPSILAAGVMALVVGLMYFIPINYIILMFLQVIVGAVVYVGISYIFKLEAFMYVFEMVKKFLIKFLKSRKGEN